MNRRGVSFSSYYRVSLVAEYYQGLISRKGDKLNDVPLVMYTVRAICKVLIRYTKQARDVKGNGL